MRIAVTYDNGKVFQHFGRTEQFKLYDVEDGMVLATQVVGSDGLGHGALAGLLQGLNVDMVICGVLGGGAQNALAEAGIRVCAGASGNADAAVAAYLRGELENTGATCGHHHHEEGHACGSHGCGGHEEGQGCSGCHGGCHSGGIQGRNVGRTCRVHYRGTLNDGTQFDSSYDRGETLNFLCGAGEMIPGFDAAVADMEVGQILDVHLMPEEAYGPSDPRAIFTVEIARLPGAEELSVGDSVYLYDSRNQPIPVTVTAKDDVAITCDANHELAGKELNFRIELVEVI